MGASLHKGILEISQEKASKLSPSDNGGFLNNIFEPIRDTNTQQVMLKRVALSTEYIWYTIKQLVLNSNHSLRVLEVLPKEVRTDNVVPPKYITAVIGGTVEMVLGIVILITIIIFPCICVCRQRRSSNKTIEENEDPKKLSKYQKICCIFFGVLTLLFGLLLAFCIPIALFQLKYLLDGISSQLIESEGIGNLNVACKQTKSFLQDLVANGSKSTVNLINDAREIVSVEIRKYVSETFERTLQKPVKQFQAVSNLENIHNQLHLLELEMKSVSKSLQGIYEVIEDISGKMEYSQKKLNESLGRLCEKIAQNDCDYLTKSTMQTTPNIEYWKSADAAVDTMIYSIRVFKRITKNIIDESNRRKNKISERTTEIVNKMANQTNLIHHFEPIVDIWKWLNDSLSTPAIKWIDNVHPQLDGYLRLIGSVFRIVGYLLLSTYLFIAVFISIYVMLCGKESLRRRKTRSRRFVNKSMNRASISSKCRIICGLVWPVLFSITIPVVITLGVLLVLMTGIVNNEICRYFTTSAGVKILDEALNMNLAYEWFEYIKHESKQIGSTRQLTTPRNVVNAAFVKCKTLPETVTQPGLFPAIGMKNIINVTQLIEQLSVQTTVRENENIVFDALADTWSHQISIEDLQTALLEIIIHGTSWNNSEFVISAIRESMSPTNHSAVRLYLDKILKANPNVSTEITDAIFILDSNSLEWSAFKDVINMLVKDLQIFETVKYLANRFEPLVADVKVSFGRNSTTEQVVRSSYQRDSKKIVDSILPVFIKLTEKFTRDSVSCRPMNDVSNILVNITCGTHGLVNLLGGTMLLTVIVAWASLLMILVFEIFLPLYELHRLFKADEDQFQATTFRMNLPE